MGHENEQGEVVEFLLIGDQVTDASLAHLTGLTALKVLNLLFTHVTDAGLAHFTGLQALEILFLANTQVTDACLAHLTRLPSLQRLALYGTEVAAVGLVHFQKLPASPRTQRVLFVGSTIHLRGHSQPTGGVSERPDRQRGTGRAAAFATPSSMRGRRAPA